MSSKGAQQVYRSGHVELELDPGKVAVWVLFVCVTAEILFPVMDYFVNYGRAVDSTGLRRFFNTAREDSFPSWFATTQTLLLALTLWATYLLTKGQSSSKWRARGWLILAVFFSYMAVDDGAQIHERFSRVLRLVVERLGVALDFFPSYSWQLIFLPVFAVLGSFTLGFLWHELDTKSSRVLLVVAFSLLGVAVAMDFIEGLDADHAWNVYSLAAASPRLDAWTTVRFEEGALDTIVHFSKSIEETIEMLAHSILWFLLLRHVGVVASGVHVRLRHDNASAASPSRSS